MYRGRDRSLPPSSHLFYSLEKTELMGDVSLGLGILLPAKKLNPRRDPPPSHYLCWCHRCFHRHRLGTVSGTNPAQLLCFGCHGNMLIPVGAVWGALKFRETTQRNRAMAHCSSHKAESSANPGGEAGFRGFWLCPFRSHSQPGTVWLLEVDHHGPQTSSGCSALWGRSTVVGTYTEE